MAKPGRAGDQAGGGRKGRRRLIAHVGVQKTGTTSLQRHLQRNAQALADRLVVLTPQEGTPMRPLGRAAIAYSLRPAPDTEDALRLAITDVLDGIPDNGLPVLLSHENLAGAMPGNGGETRLYPALPRIAALLATQAKDFAVELVFYSRNMDRWRPSVWAQAVRTDGYADTLERFLDQTAGLPGWGDLARRLAEGLGADRVTRLRLEDEPDPVRPGALLLAHAGLSEAEIAALQPLDAPSMERLNPGSTEFLRRLNGLALNPHARDRVADLVARTQPLFNADYRPAGTL